MRALTTLPGSSDSIRLDEIHEPDASGGQVLVETLAIGICGTDREIIDGLYGSPPPGEERLILGHESLGRVLEAPADSSLALGDLVVGIVRRPDPVRAPELLATARSLADRELHLLHQRPVVGRRS